MSYTEAREPDYRLQQELEEERLSKLIEALSKVANYDEPTATFLACELGIKNHWEKHNG